MSNEIVERNLVDIAANIRSLTMQAQRFLLSSAIEVGRMLVEAKALIPYGDWGNWLEKEVNYSQSTAENLMNLFEEYGPVQAGLFGESQALGNLGYTKALALISIPANEREKFIADNAVESLSTRQLNRIIKERDAALAEKARAEADAEKQKHLADEELNRMKSEATKQQKVAEDLKKELNELRAKPAIKNATEEEIAAAKAEAHAEVKKEFTKKIRAAEEAAENAIDRATRYEKKLANSDADMVKLNTLYEQLYSTFMKMVKLTKEAPDGKRADYIKLIKIVSAKLSEKAEEIA